MSVPESITVKGRLLGGGVFKARRDAGGKEQYSACVAIDNDDDVKALKAFVDQHKRDKWPNRAPNGLINWAVRVGDDPEYASYEKHYFNAKAQLANPPKLLKKTDGIISEVKAEDNLLYPGANVAVSVGCYCYDGNSSRGIKPGITLSLRAIMFRSHNDRLGGPNVNVEDEFAGISSELDEAMASDDEFMS